MTTAQSSVLYRTLSRASSAFSYRAQCSEALVYRQRKTSAVATPVIGRQLLERQFTRQLTKSLDPHFVIRERQHFQ